MAVVAATALALAGGATAHLDVRPRLLESGKAGTLLIELPELRRELTPTRLDVAGDGVEQLSSSLAGRVGVETRWEVRVRVTAEPGPLTLLLRAGFEDGRVVTAEQTLTVLPAEEGSTGLWTATVAASAAAAVSIAALVLWRRRRRT